MLKKIISRLKVNKQSIYNLNSNNKALADKPIEEQSVFNITISRENDVYRMEISDYISLTDYVDGMKLNDEYNLLDLISNSVLWNINKQMVNKGTYYVLRVGNRLYNILINGEDLAIDERIEIGDITEERVINFNISNSDYHYFSAKHYKTDTFYTKYYDKKNLVSLGKLDLSAEEAFEEISSIVCNLDDIALMTNIFDTGLIKKCILDDLDKNSPQIKKAL